MNAARVACVAQSFLSQVASLAPRTMHGAARDLLRQKAVGERKAGQGSVSIRHVDSEQHVTISAVIYVRKHVKELAKHARTIRSAMRHFETRHSQAIRNVNSHLRFILFLPTPDQSKLGVIHAISVFHR